MHEGHEHNGHDAHHKLTDEEKAAGLTPNSGKLKKDGTPVPGQTPEKDAERAVERAQDETVPEVPDVDPSAPEADPEAPKDDGAADAV